MAVTLNYTPTGRAISDFVLEEFLQEMVEHSQNKETIYVEFSTFEVFARYVEYVDDGIISPDTIQFQFHHIPISVPLQEGVEEMLLQQVFSA